MKSSLILAIVLPSWFAYTIAAWVLYHQHPNTRNLAAGILSSLVLVVSSSYHAFRGSLGERTWLALAYKCVWISTATATLFLFAMAAQEHSNLAAWAASGWLLTAVVLTHLVPKGE